MLPSRGSGTCTRVFCAGSTGAGTAGRKKVVMDRRDFIKTSGGIVVGSALGGLTFSCHLTEVSPWHGLPARGITARMAVPLCGFKYAMCNESMAEGSRLAGSQMSWVEQCQIVSNAGYTLRSGRAREWRMGNAECRMRNAES